MSRAICLLTFLVFSARGQVETIRKVTSGDLNFPESNHLKSFLKSCNEGLGSCVPFSLCSNKTEFNDGGGILQARFSDDELVEARECHYLETCCEPEDIISDKQGQSFIVQNMKERTVDECVQQCRAERNPSEYKLPPKINVDDLSPLTDSCGFRNKDGVGLKIPSSWNAAQFGEFPWMVALSEKKDSGSSYICGGSLIHQSVKN